MDKDMATKNDTEVIINGKIYTLSGYESEEYLQKVASYINNKITIFKQDDGYKRQSVDVQRTMLELNIADDYFKAKKQADSMDSAIESKSKQLYDVKHELIAAQIKNEALEKEADALKAKINELDKTIIRLETELAEKQKASLRKKTSSNNNSSEVLVNE